MPLDKSVFLYIIIHNGAKKEVFMKKKPDGRESSFEKHTRLVNEMMKERGMKKRTKVTNRRKKSGRK